MNLCEALPALIDRLSAAMEQVVVEAQLHQEKREVFLIAYLARVRSLLVGASVLCRAGEHDGIPTLYRTLFELWFHGTFLALGDDRALGLLEEQLEFETHRLDRVFGTSHADGVGARLTMCELVRELEPLIESHEEHPAGWVKKAYDTQYRITSFHHVHGHLGGVERHIDDSGTVNLNQNATLAIWAAMQ